MASISLKKRYAKVIRKLFPRGFAWDRINDPESNLYKFSDVYANEICRIHERAHTLIDEVDPRTTLELKTTFG